MRPSRRWPRLALALLGGLHVVAGEATLGVLFEGYGPGAYLIHVGAFALLLAGLPTVLARTGLYPDRRGVVTAGLAFGVLYPLAIGLLWAGLVTPPYFPTDPSGLGLAVDRLGFVLLLTPIAAGYVLGAAANATVATGRTRRRPSRQGRSRGTGAPDARRSGDLWGRTPDPTGLAVLAALLAPMLGSVVVMLGPGGEYTGGPFLLYWAALFAGGVGTVPFYLVARWGYGGDVGSPSTGTCPDGSNR